MRQLGQRIGLVHELRQLAATEELAHRRHHRPGGADQRLRRHRLRILDRHALADTALQALEPGAHMHLDQLADRADAAIAKMIDVVRLAHTVVEPDHLANDLDEILLGQDSLARPLAQYRGRPSAAADSACSDRPAPDRSGGR